VGGDPLSHLPHAYPFRFVDRILEFRPGERVVALKNVTSDEMFAVGYSPDVHDYPPRLILESMAQTAGLLNPADGVAYLGQLSGVRILRDVVAGDRLRITACDIACLGEIRRVSVFAEVDGVRVAEAEVDVIQRGFVS